MRMKDKCKNSIKKSEEYSHKATKSQSNIALCVSVSWCERTIKRTFLYDKKF